jgi:hypothetical protein
MRVLLGSIWESGQTTMTSVFSSATAATICAIIAGCDVAGSYAPPVEPDPPLIALVPHVGTPVLGTITLNREVTCAVNGPESEAPYAVIHPAIVEIEWFPETRIPDLLLPIVTALRDDTKIPSGTTRGFFDLTKFDTTVNDGGASLPCAVACPDANPIEGTAYAVLQGIVTLDELSESDISVDEAKETITERAIGYEEQPLSGCATLL